MAELPTGVEFKKSPDVFVSVAKAYAEHNWNRPNLRYDFPEFGRMPTHPERNNMVSPLIYEMLRITAGGDADQPAHDPNHTAIRLAIVEQDGDKLRAVATCTIEAVMLGSGHSRLHVGPMEGLEEYIMPFLARLRKDAWFVEAPDEIAKGSTPDKASKQNPRGAGSPGINAHSEAIQRLRDGESKELNFHWWAAAYEKETGGNPDDKSSSARELYRASVWKKYRKLTGKN